MGAFRSTALKLNEWPLSGTARCGLGDRNGRKIAILVCKENTSYLIYFH